MTAAPSFSETIRVRPQSAVISHRALTPSHKVSKAHLRARAQPKGFLDAQWPAKPPESVFASSTMKHVEYKVQTIPTGMRRPHTAKSSSLKPAAVPEVSFAPYRSLPMPEPLPGDWHKRTHYDQGAFQLGVINYPYTPADKGAIEDLEGVIHAALDHATIPLTVWNSTSAPHNAVTGRATSSRYGLNLEAFYTTEMKRAFEVRDYRAFLDAKSRMAPIGVRSEQKIGVGI